MSIVHLRVVCPEELVPAVVDLLAETAGIVAIRHAPLGAASPGLAEVNADLARECADQVLSGLHQLGITERGMIVLDEADTAIGELARPGRTRRAGRGRRRARSGTNSSPEPARNPC